MACVEVLLFLHLCLAEGGVTMRVDEARHHRLAGRVDTHNSVTTRDSDIGDRCPYRFDAVVL
jgi:hypothetical protein